MQKGFTLIELIIVVMIIAAFVIMVGSVWPFFKQLIVNFI